MIYLDSAAVIKLVRTEQHTTDLVAWLNTRPDTPLVASALVEVEVPRALRRAAPQALTGVPSALTRLYRLEIDATVRATAAAYTEPTLRSRDAIHLASAQLLASQSAGTSKPSSPTTSDFSSPPRASGYPSTAQAHNGEGS